MVKDSLNIYNTTETYVLSSDTIVDETKAYYQLDKENNTYIKVITPYGNPSENGYFEKYSYDIKIGNIETPVGQLNQVFNANNNFIVYEDGSIKATSGSFSGDITGSTGTFSGEIFASSGRIGGLEINGDFTREPIAEIREDKLVIKGTGFEVRNNNGDLSLGASSNGDLIFQENCRALLELFLVILAPHQVHFLEVYLPVQEKLEDLKFLRIIYIRKHTNYLKILPEILIRNIMYLKMENMLKLFFLMKILWK